MQVLLEQVNNDLLICEILPLVFAKQTPENFEKLKNYLKERQIQPIDYMLKVDEARQHKTKIIWKR